MVRTIQRTLLGLALQACGSPERAPPLGHPVQRIPDAGDSGSGLGQGDSDTPFGGGGRRGRGGQGGATPGGGGPSDGGPSDAAPDGANGGGGASGGPGLDSGASGSCPPKAFTGSATILSSSDLLDLAGYTSITGDLYIGSNASVPVNDVASLLGLHCLETVGGDVTLLDTPNLTSLRGLENLTSAGSLTLSTMNGLATLDGLVALALGSSLQIHACPSLTTLSKGIVAAQSFFVDANLSLPDCEVYALASRLGATCTCSNNGGICVLSPDAGP